MKKGWKTVPLGELCDVLDHKRKPITKRDREAGEYPYYGATGVLDHVAGYLFDETLVLVGEDGAKWASGESTAFAVEGKIWVNNHAHVLRPHRTVLLDNWLIYHLNHSDLTEFVSGLTVPKLNQGCLREIPVPVPPLSEQQRIVGLLDEAFEGIATAKANAEKNLQNARALFESHLQSVFTQRGPGWVEKKLGELCDILDNQRKPITKRDRVAGDIPYYGATCIQDYVKDFIFEEPLVLVGEDGAKWNSGDKTAFAVSGKCWVNNHAHVLRPHRDKITDYWLISFLTHSDLTPFVSGLTVPKLNQGNLREIPIPLPPISIQRQLAETAESLEEETQRLARLYERKHAALEALKKSLLHQAFTGAL